MEPERLERKTACLEKKRISVGIVYGDVNGLKATNDRYGHWAGDDLIRRAVGALEDSFSRKWITGKAGTNSWCWPRAWGRRILPGRWTGSAGTWTTGRIFHGPGDPVAGGFRHHPPGLREVDQAMYQDKAAYYRKHDRRRHGQDAAQSAE